MLISFRILNDELDRLIEENNQNEGDKEESEESNYLFDEDEEINSLIKTITS